MQSGYMRVDDSWWNVESIVRSKLFLENCCRFLLLNTFVGISLVDLRGATWAKKYMFSMGKVVLFIAQDPIMIQQRSNKDPVQYPANIQQYFAPSYQSKECVFGSLCTDCNLPPFRQYVISLIGNCKAFIGVIPFP